MAKKQHDIDGDPMFDTSPEARKRASNRVLEGYLRRVMSLEDDKKDIADDIKDVWSEVKAAGYSTKEARRMLALLKMEPDHRAETLALEAEYRSELGWD